MPRNDPQPHGLFFPMKLLPIRIDHEPPETILRLVLQTQFVAQVPQPLVSEADHLAAAIEALSLHTTSIETSEE